MKKNIPPFRLFKITLFISLFTFSSAFAQTGPDDWCGVGDDLPNYLQPSTHTPLPDGLDLPCGNTLRVHVYFLRYDDGSNGVESQNSFTPDEIVDQVLVTLNEGFSFDGYDPLSSPFEYIENIEFVPTEAKWNFIDNTLIATEGTLSDFLNEESRCDAINIYLKKGNIPDPNGGSALGAAVIFPSDVSTGYYVRVNNFETSFDLFPKVQVHEMGHVLGLQHTHNRTPYFLSPSNDVFVHQGVDTDNWQSIDVLNPFGTNCAVAGDCVCDTYPIAYDQTLPGLAGHLLNYSCEPVAGDISFNYMPNNHIENYTDQQPGLIEWPIRTNVVEQANGNYMSYLADACKNHLTPGQSMRIVDQIFASRALQRASATFDISYDVFNECLSGNNGVISFNTEDYCVQGDEINIICLNNDCPSQAVNYTFSNLPAGDYTFEISAGPSSQSNCFQELVTITIEDATYDYPSGEIASSGSNYSNQELTFGGNLVIHDGVDLTITNSVLSFEENTGIVVEPGGALTINGSTLTRFECNDGYWNGIEVIGPLAISPSPPAGALTIKDNSVVEYALLGAANYRLSSGPNFSAGGVMVLTHTEFIDCQSALRFRSRLGVNLLDDDSYMKACTFKWTNNLPYLNVSQPHPMLDIDKVQLEIVRCNFINENNAVLTSGNVHHAHRPAIFSNKGRLDMIGDQSEFYQGKIVGFRYGIVQYHGDALVDQYAFNNYRSAYVLASNGSVFTRNKFGILNSAQYSLTDMNSTEFKFKAHYGLYLDNSTGYWVEDNDFYMAWPGGNTPNLGEREGLFVRNSGPAQNEIYLNRFSHCVYATLSFDHNRNSSGDPAGLKYHCNEFYNNSIGINTHSTDSNVNGWGIHPSQGEPPAPPFQGISAGNYFEGQTDVDMRNDVNLGPITYQWNISDTPPGVGITWDGNVVIELQMAEPRTCETTLSRSQGQRMAMASSEKEEADLLRAEHQALVDGGDTDALVSEVILTQYGEALELYYELMAKTPHLSEKVMIEAINKEAELPGALLSLILESNPQAGKSLAVGKELDERMTPLDEYQRYMIAQGRLLLSQKEVLESHIAAHELSYVTALGQAIATVKRDSTVADKRAEIEALISGREHLAARYHRIDLAIADADYVLAEELLEDIPSDFALKGLKEEEYQDLYTCYTIWIDRLLVESNSLTPAQESELLLIADKQHTRGSGLAIVLLSDYSGYLFDELLVAPDETPKSLNTSTPDKPKFTNEASFALYPNPAADHVILQFRNWKELVELQVSDGLGRILIQEQVNTNKDIYVLDLSSITTGSYSLSLFTKDGQILDQRSLEVIR